MSQTKKLPSRIKYEKNNPTVSFRVTKDLRDVLEDIKERTGKSYAGIVKEVLTKAEETWEKAFEEGCDEGYEAATMEYRIWYNCSVCGKKIFIDPNSKIHKKVIEYLRKEGWGHKSCHDREKH